MAPPQASRRTSATVVPAGTSAICSAEDVERDAWDERVKAAPLLSKLPLRTALISGGASWLLFAVVFDPPFAVYWLLANALVGFVAADHLAQRSWRGRRVAGLALLAVVGSTALLALLWKFELSNLEHYDAAPISLAAGGEGDGDGSQPRVHFLRLHNPQVRYSDDVEAIHAAMNRNKAVEGGNIPESKTLKEDSELRVQRYAVHPTINAWSSDVLRYAILLQFWSQTDARPEQEEEELDERLDPLQRHRREKVDSKRVEILCVVETDVAFRESYFSDSLRAYQQQREAAQQNLELAHIQHFWGHHTLEPFNIGVLCTSSRASPRTRLWVRLMRALHAKRYRRLLYLDFLYAFLPDRFVFSWDQHHGCTEYYPHCHYIHFTRPKGEGIRRAMRAIAAEEEATS